MIYKKRECVIIPKTDVKIHIFFLNKDQADRLKKEEKIQNYSRKWGKPKKQRRNQLKNKKAPE
jgi:hypothetical protein